MRYSGTHKEETRNRIVAVASRQVRARGPDGVSVAEVMAEAGLTHGGFYAHFKSKDALIAAAIEAAFENRRTYFRNLPEATDDGAFLERFVDSYVSAIHRDRPERGCPVATLSSDIPRQGEAARAAFDAGVRGLIQTISSRLTVGAPEDRQALAGSLVTEMAGAVALARAVSDPELSDRLLEQSRRSVKARMGLPISSPEQA
jgi:TetR/AcrR family transcriptional repressor of nem operon